MSIESSSERIKIAKALKSTHLNLYYQHLSDNELGKLIPEMKDMPNLTSLDLRGNNFTNVSVLLELANLQVLDLRANNLPFPNEILEDFENASKILIYLGEYYAQQSQGNLRKLNEAKLIVIGEANVGKTCLINRLLDKKFIKTNPTHGIQIRKWKDIKLANGEKVQMNVWDFGGQEIMHTTHQFFFSNRTIYLLIINARENEDKNKTEEWLQRIQTLSKQSPVFIVGNKIDENNRAIDCTTIGYFDIERKRLYEKFPDLIKGIYGVSSDVHKTEYDFLFAEFETALVAEIGKLENIHNEFPAKWFEVKNKLEKMKEDKVPFIKYGQYLTYCIQAGMEIEENYKTWIEFLNDIGVALTYYDDKNLGNYLAVLNPQWITNGVYSLIDNAQITLNRGILQRNEIVQYLKEEEYPIDTQEFILNMMRKFRLLIDIERDKTFLIPDLLPKDEPDTGSWEDVLHFQYGYEIYEKSIIRRFMVEMFGFCSKNTYWRNGIVLKREENRALVRADVQDKTISIKIDGNPNARREFFAIIAQKFNEIHNSFDNLKAELKLGHPQYSNILRPHERLYLMEKDDPEAIEFVEELFKKFPVKDWLNGFRSDAQISKKNISSGNTVNNFYGNAQVNQDKATGTQNNDKEGFFEEEQYF